MKPCLPATCLASRCSATALPAADPWLFIYFREPANMGIFYATSDDGYGWKELHGGKPWIAICQPGELMRDPFLTRGPDHQFHVVWTWGWRHQSIGYAHSADLVHWSAEEVHFPEGCKHGSFLRITQKERQIGRAHV